jgi:hypothetical protein
MMAFNTIFLFILIIFCDLDLLSKCRLTFIFRFFVIFMYTLDISIIIQSKFGLSYFIDDLFFSWVEEK